MSINKYFKYNDITIKTDKHLYFLVSESHIICASMQYKLKYHLLLNIKTKLSTMIECVMPPKKLLKFLSSQKISFKLHTHIYIYAYINNIFFY